MFTALQLEAVGGSLYALRGDGTVFVLIRRGDIVGGQIVVDPYWAAVPAVPGTEGAAAQEG